MTVLFCIKWYWILLYQTLKLFKKNKIYLKIILTEFRIKRRIRNQLLEIDLEHIKWNYEGLIYRFQCVFSPWFILWDKFILTNISHVLNWKMIDGDHTISKGHDSLICTYCTWRFTLNRRTYWKLFSIHTL